MRLSFMNNLLRLSMITQPQILILYLMKIHHTTMMKKKLLNLFLKCKKFLKLKKEESLNLIQLIELILEVLQTRDLTNFIRKNALKQKLKKEST